MQRVSRLINVIILFKRTHLYSVVCQFYLNKTGKINTKKLIPNLMQDKYGTTLRECHGVRIMIIPILCTRELIKNEEGTKKYLLNERIYYGI